MSGAARRATLEPSIWTDGHVWHAEYPGLGLRASGPTERSAIDALVAEYRIWRDVPGNLQALLGGQTPAVSLFWHESSRAEIQNRMQSLLEELKEEGSG